ncbi:MAG: hypothetical protein HY370_10170 [Proteobacteria bacterium]|nr:hypothetical protein [Pseudomonadota bacterium]
MDKKREKLVGEAMETLRMTRRAIDPRILDHARRIIEKHAGRHQEVFQPPSAENGKVPVDRQKNLSVILQFIKTNNNAALNSKIKSLLGK